MLVSSLSLAFASVYSPNSDVDRWLLWEELVGLISWWDVLWCIGSDFNMTHFPSERSGATSFSISMEESPLYL
jgi:hypothetical protein